MYQLIRQPTMQACCLTAITFSAAQKAPYMVKAPSVSLSRTSSDDRSDYTSTITNTTSRAKSQYSLVETGVEMELWDAPWAMARYIGCQPH